MKAANATSPHRKRRSRMVSSSGGTRQWWQWRVLL
jgi:hypothetical protein